MLKPKSLTEFYELQVDVRIGFNQCYARWDEDAIKSHEISLDLRLRDEGLRFIDRYAGHHSLFYDPRIARHLNQASIERDSAVRWVKRYLARGDFEKASQVAKNLRQSEESSFDWDNIDDPLYKADLLAAWGEALVHASAPEQEARSLLEQAVLLLQNGHEEQVDESWRPTRILGRAHTYLGYLYRIQGRYGLALQENKRALPYLKEVDISEERANTLNNLAFLLALLGRVNLALHHIDQALKMRQDMGRQYPIALSLNTQGRIHTLQDHPMWGEHKCREALQIFEELQEPRGIALACNGLGFALRKRGDQWKQAVYTPEEAEQFFQEASKIFQRAVYIFSEQVPEPIRLWEAYNELGSLYCDWGWLARRQGDSHTALKYYDRSISYQKNALKIAQKYDLQFPISDSYDDLAQAYGDRGFLLEFMGKEERAQKSHRIAEKYLNRVVRIVPKALHLVPGVGFREAQEPGEAYWLALGKVYLQRGIWTFRRVDQSKSTDSELKDRLGDGIRYFTLATAYFQRYWPQSYAFDKTLLAFASRLGEAHVSAEMARTIVQQVISEYRLNLDALFETIDNILGV